MYSVVYVHMQELGESHRLKLFTIHLLFIELEVGFHTMHILINRFVLLQLFS